jgi:hypothetical protein
MFLRIKRSIHTGNKLRENHAKQSGSKVGQSFSKFVGR